MPEVSAESIPARAERAYLEFLAVVADARELPPLSRLAVLCNVVRASAELRVQAERGVGLLLLEHPDRGGRPSPCRPTPIGRRLRQALNLNGTLCSWLVRLAAEIDDDAFAAIVEEIWQGYPSAARLAARSIVLGERDGSGGDPPPSPAGPA